MRVKYIGMSIGVDGLTDGQEYDCLGIEGEFLRVIDDSGEDYLYPIDNPASLNGKKGEWLVTTDTGESELEYALSRLTV